jgi:hypothetical protein
MKILRSRSAIALSSAAALAMTATPAFADRWGGGGWGHRDRHDDTGWIVGGIIGIGVIAAIAASASSKKKREEEARYPNREYRNDDYRGSDSRNDGYATDRDYRSNDANRSSTSRANSRGIDGAVDTCVYEVERGSNRVDTVDSVDRDGEGWRVTGRMSGGREFACSTDRDGRIRSATVDGRAAG